jgi:hypothetical protein
VPALKASEGIASSPCLAAARPASQPLVPGEGSLPPTRKLAPFEG